MNHATDQFGAPVYGPDDIATKADTPADTITTKIINSVDDFDDLSMTAAWNVEPFFDFQDEVAALQVVDLLGEQVRDLRRQIAHTMRYLKLAANAAIEQEVTSKNAIVTNSGLARQTVYNLFDE